MDNRVAINTGPIIAFGKMECLGIIEQLPFEFVVPERVLEEVITGERSGYASSFPSWVRVKKLEIPLSPLALASIDEGEAAVIELALQNDIPKVCIDDKKGRRAALASGLEVIGSLGMIGRAKEIGLIDRVAPLIQRAQQLGYYYDQNLVNAVLNGLGEN